MPELFDPIRLRSLEIRNRVWVPPMCQYSALERDGLPGDWHLVHYGAFATGGAGLVIAEATAVTPEGRISLHDTGLWSDQQVAAWRRVTDFVRGQGAAMGVQLAHAGRKASTYPAWSRPPLDGGATGSMPASFGGWQTVAPSAIAFGGLAAPREIAADELPGIVEAFRAAAARAMAAGFDLVELHAAHGYLLHEFLSPLSNHRRDEYGGSTRNRARLLLEVVDAVRREIGPGTPLLVRYSASDWADGGLEAEEVAQVAAWAHEAGADLADVSTGGLVAEQRIQVGPGYQVPHAETVRERGGVAVSAVGLVTEPKQAAKLVHDGRVDAVMLGRAHLRDPHWAIRAAHELGVELPWPPQYERATTTHGW